jgi:acetoin utilization protein AcuB
MKVKDIFQKKVDFITPDATLLDAAKIIFGHNHKGVPVVKLPKKKLIGFITEQDILSQLFPNIKDIIEDYAHARDFELMEGKVKSVLTKKVKDVMSKRIIAIHVDEPVLEAESIMKLKDISRLPVVDNKGNLTGIISKADIFKALISVKTRGFK